MLREGNPAESPSIAVFHAKVENASSWPYQTKTYHTTYHIPIMMDRRGKYVNGTPPEVPTPPHLATLTLKPSWVNRAGSIDRSACCEIRASELWRLIDSSGWKPVRSRNGPEAQGSVTITGRMLRDFHDHRLPFELIGDRRTAKSNVMKGRVKDANPNKGASREKKLGLWAAGEIGFPDQGWTQTLRVERWARGNSKLAKSDKGTKRQREKTAEDHPVPLSLCPSVTPSNQHFLICPQCHNKFVKLFLPLTTQAEENDAELAEGWIRLIQAHPRFRLQLDRNQALRTRFDRITARYGLLFRSRRMLCRKCLGLRYGEVKRSRRIAAMDAAHHAAYSSSDKGADKPASQPTDKSANAGPRSFDRRDQIIRSTRERLAKAAETRSKPGAYRYLRARRRIDAAIRRAEALQKNIAREQHRAATMFEREQRRAAKSSQRTQHLAADRNTSSSSSSSFSFSFSSASSRSSASSSLSSLPSSTTRAPKSLRGRPPKPGTLINTAKGPITARLVDLYSHALKLKIAKR
jgi:hypothetical protein